MRQKKFSFDHWVCSLVRRTSYWWCWVVWFKLTHTSGLFLCPLRSTLRCFVSTLGIVPLWRSKEGHFPSKVGIRECLHLCRSFLSILSFCLPRFFKSVYTVALHYTTLHYTTPHHTTPHHTTPHHTTPHYTTLHYTTLHYTTLHYTILHYTTLHYTTLHYIFSLVSSS